MIAAVLTYGGISLFVVIFAIIPLARPIFKKLDMAWNLISIPVMLGMATFTMTSLPGTPSIQNVIPTTLIGTTLTAAPVLGILATIASLAFGLWYMKYELNKSIKAGENYATFTSAEHHGPAAEAAAGEEVKLPNIIASVFPLVILIIIILIGSAMKIPNIILVGLIIANVSAAICFITFIKDHKAVINAGSQGSVVPIFLTAAAVGFGTVITAAPTFKVVSAAILKMPGSPLISLSVATMIMSVITGSASGTIAIIISAFGKAYMNMGMSADVIHRVTVIASAALTAMPHSGVCLSFFALTHLNHKNGFKRFFLTITGANCAALVAVLLGNILLGLK
jgi:H+/gluconate symporter-like permease